MNANPCEAMRRASAMAMVFTRAVISGLGLVSRDGAKTTTSALLRVPKSTIKFFHSVGSLVAFSASPSTSARFWTAVVLHVHTLRGPTACERIAGSTLTRAVCTLYSSAASSIFG